MLIKPADDRTQDLDDLRSLSTRADVTPATRKKIEQEIRKIQSGLRGEQEAAYEIEFHYDKSRNWMTIHDLRIECEGRVAQIDHLLINRFLEFYVCESKRFAEGVSVNEDGEFTAFYNGRAYGVASPLEQNRRHIAVLQSVLKNGQVPLPRRLGLAIKPTMISLVLVSKNARISRPKKKIEGIDAVIKNDQLNARISKNIEADNNLLGIAKILGQDTLEAFARTIAAQHRPLRTDWAARFGLPVAVSAAQRTPCDSGHPPTPAPADEALKAASTRCVAPSRKRRKEI